LRHERIGSECQITGIHCLGYRGTIAAKIATIRTPTRTEIPVATRPPTLPASGKVGDSRNGERAIKPRFDTLFQVALYAIEFHGGQKGPVRKLCQTFGTTADTDVSLDVVIPWRNIRVPNRPVHGQPLLEIRFKIQIAQSVTLTPPDQRPSSHLVAPKPLEWLLLDVRLLLVLRIENLVPSIKSLTLYGVFLYDIPRIIKTQVKVPGMQHGGRVVLYMLNTPPPIKQQGFKPLFA